jgi:hypothetical protein
VLEHEREYVKKMDSALQSMDYMSRQLARLSADVPRVAEELIANNKRQRDVELALAKMAASVGLWSKLAFAAAGAMISVVAYLLQQRLI